MSIVMVKNTNILYSLIDIVNIFYSKELFF